MKNLKANYIELELVKAFEDFFKKTNIKKEETKSGSKKLEIKQSKDEKNNVIYKIFCNDNYLGCIISTLKIVNEKLETEYITLIKGDDNE